MVDGVLNEVNENEQRVFEKRNEEELVGVPFLVLVVWVLPFSFFL